MGCVKKIIVLKFEFKMYNYDDLINYVGLSSYQIVIMICSSLMIWPSGLNNVAPMFLMETPPFHAQQAWLDQRVEFEAQSLMENFRRFLTQTENLTQIESK